MGFVLFKLPKQSHSSTMSAIPLCKSTCAVQVLAAGSRSTWIPRCRSSRKCATCALPDLIFVAGTAANCSIPRPGALIARVGVFRRPAELVGGASRLQTEEAPLNGDAALESARVSALDCHELSLDLGLGNCDELAWAKFELTCDEGT